MPVALSKELSHPDAVPHFPSVLFGLTRWRRFWPTGLAMTWRCRGTFSAENGSGEQRQIHVGESRRVATPGQSSVRTCSRGCAFAQVR